MTGGHKSGIRMRLRRELPALIVASMALFVALSSSGLAAGIVPPLAKRALNANHAKTAKTAKTAANALKLNGLRATDIAAIPGPGTDAATLNGLTAAQIAATPGPSGSLSASLFTYRQDSFELDAEGAFTRVTAMCQTGEKAVGGGWDQVDGAGYVLQDSPNSDDTGWRFVIWGESGNNLAAVGNVWVTCAKVS